jgi:septal ring factor EnvC (AmiA/AmiB activator)
MEFRPQFDPYDAIIALDQQLTQHKGQILELAKSQNAQARQISTLIKTVTELRNEIVLLRQQLSDTMQLQIDALQKLNDKRDQG